MKVTYYAVEGLLYDIAAVVGNRWFHFDEGNWRISVYGSDFWLNQKINRKVSKKYVLLKGQYLLTEQEYKEVLTNNPLPVKV